MTKIMNQRLQGTLPVAVFVRCLSGLGRMFSLKGVRQTVLTKKPSAQGRQTRISELLNREGEQRALPWLAPC